MRDRFDLAYPQNILTIIYKPICSYNLTVFPQMRSPTFSIWRGHGLWMCRSWQVEVPRINLCTQIVQIGLFRGLTLVVALRLHHTSLKHQIDFIENVTSFPRNVTLPKQMIQFHISPTDLQHQVGQGPLSFPLVFCRSISVALIWDIRILSRFLGSTYLPEPRKTQLRSAAFLSRTILFDSVLLWVGDPTRASPAMNAHSLLGLNHNF